MNRKDEIVRMKEAVVQDRLQKAQAARQENEQEKPATNQRYTLLRTMANCLSSLSYVELMSPK